MIKETADAGTQLSGSGKVLLTGAAMSAGSSVWAWLGTHHEQLTAVSAIIGALCAIIGLISSLWARHKRGD